MAEAPQSPTTRALVWRLWRAFVRPYWRALAAALALMTAFSATTFAAPFLVAWVGDAFAAGDVSVVFLAPPLLIAAAVLRNLALYAQTVLTNSVALKVVRDLQTALFARLTGLDFARISGAPTGELVSYFASDAQLLRQTLIRAPNSLIRDPLQIAALIAAMLWRDWLLAAVVLLIYPVAAIPVLAIGRRLRRISSDAQAQMGSLSAYLTERIGAARLIKTYNLEAAERAAAADAFDRRAALLQRTVRARAAVEPVIEVIGAAAVSGVIALAGYRISQGAMTVGDFLGFVTALIMLAQPARSLGTVSAVMQEGLAGAERIFAVLDEAPAIADAPDAEPLRTAKGRIVFEDVRFSYGDDRPALNGLSFTAEPGTVTAFVGPSGAGKSTIFNLLPRLYEPSGGRVLIDGTDIRGVTLASLRAHIAVVSQDAVALSESVAANIAFGAPWAEQARIVAAAKAAAAHDFIEALPQGYDTVLGEGGAALSGGQLQRIALARAILKDAPILLLDEATSALDAASERDVQAALERLREGRTTLVIAHRLATVRSADRLYVLDNGCVVEEGTHTELHAKGGLYRRLCDLQLRGDEDAG
ncbi:MAG: ABC transporter transmembrane domain-containing protein [Pseudomonadota bacterium]